MQITLSESDLLHLKDEYPSLRCNSADNSISGEIFFDLTYNKIRIKDQYTIKFDLFSALGSILPKVYETDDKILSIAKRKKIDKSNLHLNNEEGELCIIIPPKEKEKYPNGFNLKEFLKHIEEHLYWVSFYDRFDKGPWKDQDHGFNGFKELYHEDSSYRDDVKNVLETVAKRSLSRAEIRRMVKK